MRASMSTSPIENSPVLLNCGIRPLVVEAFEASSKTRSYRYITHELRGLDEPIIVSEKVLTGIGGQGTVLAAS